MSGAQSTAGGFGCRPVSLFCCASSLLGRVQGAVRWMLAGPGPGWQGGPWERGWRKGRWEGPGFGGPWGGWWPGQSGAGRGPKAGRGDVRAAILALLREGPRNGYQIMSEIHERSGGVWRPSPGARSA